VAAHDLDLGPAIRSALIDETEISSHLALCEGEPGVFTRRPVPAEAEYPMVIVNDPAALGDEDGVNSDRPVWMGDVAFYGRVAAPGSPEDQTRIVQQIALRARLLFHRQRFALQVEGFHVIDIRASGPVPGPVDDDKEVGRVVSLIIRLRRNA
jgi:hypothetical protein